MYCIWHLPFASVQFSGIRIPNCLGLLDPCGLCRSVIIGTDGSWSGSGSGLDLDPFIVSKNKMKKKLYFYNLVATKQRAIFKDWCKCTHSAVSNKQKIRFFLIFWHYWRKEKDPESVVYGLADPLRIRSPTPVGRRVVISSFKLFLPVFATLRARGDLATVVHTQSQTMKFCVLSLSISHLSALCRLKGGRSLAGTNKYTIEIPWASRP